MKNKILKFFGYFILLFILIASAFTLIPKIIKIPPRTGFQITFDYEGHPRERQALYEYYRNLYKENPVPPIKKSEIGIYLYDIDGDGKKEIISYLKNYIYCGLSGCSFEIFKALDNAGKITGQIPTGISTHENIKILPTETLGSKDLLFYDGWDELLSLWKWDGKSYGRAKVLKEGYEVKFDYEGYPQEREAIYQYYLKEYGIDEYFPIKKSEIGICLYDLNGDNKKEILVYLKNRGWCGALGCDFKIFAPLDKEIGSLLFTGINVHENIKILDTQNAGYHDLLFYDFCGDMLAMWRWNDIKYKRIKIFKDSY